MKNIFTMLMNRLKNEDGQTLVEYALILVLVSVAVILMLTGLGTQVGAVFTSITGTLSGV
ncbi:MAG TPA: Flp family type IVb pilin [Nitrospirota bacterium]